MKKIIIGSIFAIFILIMSSSISAVGYSTILENNKSQRSVNIQNKDIENFMEKIKDEGLWKRPFLTLFVKIVLISQYIRMMFLSDFAEGENYNPFTGRIQHPIIYLWAMTILFRMNLWGRFWQSVGIDVTIF